MNIGLKALKITGEFLQKVFLEAPETTQKNTAELDETITSIVNIRTPNLAQGSDEFNEKYDKVLNEVSAMYQGKHRFFLISAQELLKMEQQSQEPQLQIVR